MWTLRRGSLKVALGVKDAASGSGCNETRSNSISFNGAAKMLDCSVTAGRR
jgi:hypothetical protein